MMDITEIKILLCGNSGIGKTSIFKRYYENIFKADCNKTLGIDFQTKEIKHNDKLYSIHVIDTAGEEKQRSIIKSYFHMADYYLLVFDLTNKNSLFDLSEWIELLKEHIEKPKYFILGNKSDLERYIISDDEINDFLSDKDVSKINGENFLKVSAKTGENIKQAFKYILDIIEQDNDDEDEQIIITRQKVKNKEMKTNCC